MREKILSKLTNGLEEMVNKYHWLSAKYEYNARRGVYLVSYFFPDGYDSLDFVKDAMAFEDEVNDLFADNAPLFCDNEELFSLSKSATKISFQKSTKETFFSPVVRVAAWDVSTGLEESLSSDTSYALAV